VAPSASSSRQIVGPTPPPLFGLVRIRLQQHIIMMHRTDDAQLTLGKTVGRPVRERRPGNVCIDNLRCSPIPVLNIFHNFRCLNKAEVRLVPLSNIRECLGEKTYRTHSKTCCASLLHTRGRQIRPLSPDWRVLRLQFPGSQP
jgi:hypothetical protein